MWYLIVLSHFSLISIASPSLHTYINPFHPFLTSHAAAILVQRIIISWIDYCNSLLLGLPNNSLYKLQLLQSSAAWIVTRTPSREHNTLVHQHLQWLPIESWINFKFLILVFRWIDCLAPPCLCALLHIAVQNTSVQMGLFTLNIGCCTLYLFAI